MISFMLIALAVLPGIAIGCILKQGKYLLILATPLSLSLYILVFLLLQSIDFSRYTAHLYLLLSLAALASALTVKNSRDLLLEHAKTVGLFVPIACAIAIYHAMVGAFVDHGIDVYQHMVFVQSSIEHLKENNGDLQFSLVLGTHNYVFHNIAALVSSLYGLSAWDLIEVLAVAYSLIWTFSVFVFCKYVFEQLSFDRNKIWVACFLAIFFYWTAFGINNFSMPRYYIAGPVILNYCIYLAALVLLFELLKTNLRPGAIAVLFIILATATVLHPQEVLLFFSFAFTLSMVLIAARLLNYDGFLDFPQQKALVWKAGLILIAGISIIAASIVLLEKYRFDPIPLRNLGLFSEKLIDWNILRPNHQFFTVLGLWGLYLYVLSIINVRYIKNSGFIVAGLVVPLVTVFNPIFAEAYMRITYPKVLWRVLYALPLPIVASFLICHLLDFQQKVKVFKRIVSLVLVFPLFGLLIVFDFGPIQNSMAKSPSLDQSNVENSYRHWIDLLQYLENMPSAKKILTDPSTGYLIRSLTKHSHSGFKFYKKRFKEFNFEDYADDPLAKYKGWLLVVNNRDGKPNTSFQPPLHIYPDIMVTSKHYFDSLKAELQNNPAKYEKLWSQNQISVYLIR